MPRCTAHAKSTGNPCKRSAIAGATVCRVHGGAAPQVQAKAAERLASMVHPALDQLLRIVNDPLATDTSKLRGIENVLDRAGHPRQHDVAVDATRAQILEALEQIE